MQCESIRRNLVPMQLHENVQLLKKLIKNNKNQN